MLAYFFGGIPIGLLVGRARGIDDIRKYGSGNIGASNVLRVIGVKAGLFVWFMDMLKGLLPVLAARLVFRSGAGAAAGDVAGAMNAQWWLAAVAVAAMAGHCFSPYLRLTGGRGVSTSLGVIIGLDWRVGLIAFGVWALVVAVSRYISLGSMVGCASAVGILALFRDPLPYIVAAAIIALIVIIRHAGNIQRLLNGTERKIGQKEHIESGVETPL